MKNPLFSLLAFLWLFPTSLLAQDSAIPSTSNTLPKARQGQLYFSIGTEYRIGHIYNFSNNSVWYARGLSVEDLNRGAAFSYSLDYFITDNLSLGFPIVCVTIIFMNPHLMPSLEGRVPMPLLQINTV